MKLELRKGFIIKSQQWTDIAIIYIYFAAYLYGYI